MENTPQEEEVQKEEAPRDTTVPFPVLSPLIISGRVWGVRESVGEQVKEHFAIVHIDRPTKNHSQTFLYPDINEAALRLKLHESSMLFAAGPVRDRVLEQHPETLEEVKAYEQKHALGSDFDIHYIGMYARAKVGEAIPKIIRNLPVTSYENVNAKCLVPVQLRDGGVLFKVPEEHVEAMMEGRKITIHGQHVHLGAPPKKTAPSVKKRTPKINGRKKAV